MRSSPIPRSRRGLPTVGGTVATGSPADFGKLIADETDEVGEGYQVLRHDTELTGIP